MKISLNEIKKQLATVQKLFEEEKFNLELSNVTIDSLQRELSELKSTPRNKVFLLFC